MQSRFSTQDRMLHLGMAALLACSSVNAWGQAVSPKSAEAGKPATKEQARADANKKPAERGDVVDRLVAIVNNDIVLESDVEEEERFSKLYPYRIATGDSPREQALARLIDRDLILQQIRAPQPDIPESDIDKEETDLRKDLPACVKADCASAQGWKAFLAQSGFTEEELRARLRLRREVLRFIAQRFRNGIRISDQQVEDFYTTTMLPQYQKEHATPPPLSALSTRIQEVLLQQQVSALLDQWLKSLRESGSVRILKAGEETP